MYLWYVYQPSRSDRSKKGKKDPTIAAVVAPSVSKEKESKKERRERTKSSSRVRGSGACARNLSSCSTASTASVSSSASTADSDNYSEFDSLSADSSLYGGPFGYPHTTCSSVREVEMADFADFEMGDAECLQGQGQLQTLSLPLSLSMPSLSGLRPLFEIVSWMAPGNVNTCAMQIRPIESDVKHGMGEEESAYLVQREDCALGVIVHRQGWWWWWQW
ncbi:uncharacterized protein FOMMEDRAFT_150196 [Fomitiporia mediterranea MF3/22]|uniref:uncharacterized protein n=1 Tax=Fomitiporia mediterranea (strain MF3/22) TaxID=694068 RepID=UPI0004407520|nr:uncharacterized protein FOMMEDRAFT_150196 [Fomitiporia mediterranea MF3/22]EJD07656.1 hypothetical protein FOMMEDRAFT_150196 [Fomitiporia mediterranea MF3/22]